MGEANHRKQKFIGLYGTDKCPGSLAKDRTNRVEQRNELASLGSWVTVGHFIQRMNAAGQLVPVYVPPKPYNMGKNAAKRAKRRAAAKKRANRVAVRVVEMREERRAAA
jgi:hypothetical protein